MPLRLFNSFTKSVQPFAATDPGRVTFYSCGPTVYDDAHIGNFRSFLAADLLRRWIESPLCVIQDRSGALHDPLVAPAKPRTVVHVMNITDVGHMTDDDLADGGGEDKMLVAGRRIAEAKKAGKIPDGVEVNPSDPYQVARFYESRFKEDARALGLTLAVEAERDATLMPRATESVLGPLGMIAVIGALIAKQHAYVVGEAGSRVVYFDVRTFPAYGTLSGNTLGNLREGEGGRVSGVHQSQKKHPADFLLWKEDASHVMKWESPWGAGYPGWHIECTAMSFARLVGAGGARGVAPGAPLIDLHSGGEDNIFPHHECEIAQSCCAHSGAAGSFAGHWFHARFLFVEGAKMSKRAGTFFTPRELFATGVEPAALRLELVRTHYRSNSNFTMQGLTDSQRMVGRWRRVADAHPVSTLSPDQRRAASEHPVAQEFARAMHEDLNIAQAIAAINSWVGSQAVAGGPTAGDGAVMRLLDKTLGVLGLARPEARESAIGVFAPGVAGDPRVEALLVERREARAKKDFATSDRIRDELAGLGYAIKDTPSGRVEVRRA